MGAEPRDAAARRSCARRPAARSVLLGATRRGAPLGRTSTRPRTSASGTRRSRSASAAHGVSQPISVLGQHRADDVLLLRRRARGAARVRHGRAARAAARRAAARRRARRDARADRDLPRVQRRHARGARLGCAMSTDTAFALGMLALVGPRFPIRLRAFMLTVVRRRRRRRARRDRDRLHDASRRRPLAARRRAPRCRRACSSRSSAFSRALVYVALGLAAWVATVQVGRRPGRRRPRRWGCMTYASPAARADLERATDLFRLFREQPTPELARSASDRPPVGDLAERAAAAALPPVDELRDRAAVRARERGDPDRRRLPLARLHLAGDARDPRSATCSGKPVGVTGGALARHEAQPRPAAAAGRLGGGRGRRHRSPASASPSRC